MPRAYTVRLSSHMEAAPLELAEVLEEDGDERSDVLRPFLRRALRMDASDSP